MRARPCACASGIALSEVHRHHRWITTSSIGRDTHFKQPSYICPSSHYVFYTCRQAQGKNVETPRNKCDPSRERVADTSGVFGPDRRAAAIALINALPYLINNGTADWPRKTSGRVNYRARPPVNNPSASKNFLLLVDVPQIYGREARDRRFQLIDRYSSSKSTLIAPTARASL